MTRTRSLALYTLLVITFWLSLFGSLFASGAFGSCHTKRCHARHAAYKERLAWRHRFYRESYSWRSWGLSTATCESGRRWHINTGNGFYGGLQFTSQTAYAAGFTRLPHLTSSWEQLVRGIRWAQREGRGHWPVCG